MIFDVVNVRCLSGIGYKSINLYVQPVYMGIKRVLMIWRVLQSPNVRHFLWVINDLYSNNTKVWGQQTAYLNMVQDIS